jgi:hypothetical protein
MNNEKKGCEIGLKLDFSHWVGQILLYQSYKIHEGVFLV